MLTEKAAYLKGLMEGLDIDGSTKEGKILLAMKDVIEEIDEDVDQICDFCERMDEDLCALENSCDDDCCCDDCCCHCGDNDDDDEEDEDDCEFEVVCPTCGDTIELNDLMIEDGSVECPNCGELLEFDIDEEDDGDEE